MSFQNPDGTSAEIEPRQPDLIEETRVWAGEDRQRLRQLAALTLRANGWQQNEIADVLGFSGDRAVRRSIERCRSNLEQHLREQAEQGRLELQQLRGHGDLPGHDVDETGFRSLVDSADCHP